MRFGGTQSRPQWLQVGLGLALLVAMYVFLVLVGSNGLGAAGATGLTALITLVGSVLGSALILWGVARQFTTSTYALIPIAIAINVVIGQIVRTLKLPLYLDSIGTVFVGVLAGPWAGAATGGLSNVIAGLTVDPPSLVFAVVAIAIGLLAGLFAQLGWMRRFYLAPIAGFITGIIAALLSAPLAAYVFSGVTGTGMDAVVLAFRAYGSSILEATTKQGLTTDTIDKLITFTLVYLIVLALPPRLRARFSQSSPAADKLPR